MQVSSRIASAKDDEDVAIVRTGKIEPPPDPLAPVRQLLRDGRNNEAVARLGEILAAAPNDLPARELLFDAQFQRRSWDDALAEIQLLRHAKPDSTRYRIY